MKKTTISLFDFVSKTSSKWEWFVPLEENNNDILYSVIIGYLETVNMDFAETRYITIEDATQNIDIQVAGVNIPHVIDTELSIMFSSVRSPAYANILIDYFNNEFDEPEEGNIPFIISGQKATVLEILLNLENIGEY